MQLVGTRGQFVKDYLFDASGVTGTGSKLILPEANSRSMLVLQNLSNGSLYFEFGAARATCTLTGTGVGSVVVSNAGFNYTLPPIVTFLGGGRGGNGRYTATAGPNFPQPSRVAQAHAVLTAGAVSSIVVDDPGIGYYTAPLVFLSNSPNDPNGCADPSTGGGSGLLLASGSNVYLLNGTACPTDAVSVYAASSGLAYLCKYMA